MMSCTQKCFFGIGKISYFKDFYPPTCICKVYFYKNQEVSSVNFWLLRTKRKFDIFLRLQTHKHAYYVFGSDTQNEGF